MTPQKSLTDRTSAELALLALVWGGSFLAIRTLLDEVGVLTAVAWRVAPAAAALWLWALLRGHRLPRAPAVWGAFLVMGVLNNVIPLGLTTWAQLHIETGLTAILNATTAIFGVLLAAAAFRDERLTARKAASVALGFAGVGAAIGPGALAGLDLRSLAQLAVLAGTVSYACAGLWARRRLGGVAPEVAAAGMLSASALVLVPVAVVAEGPPRLALAPATWAAVGYGALAATALAYVLYYRVLAMAGAASLLFVTLMIPPVAIALGAAVRGEALGPGAFLGLGLLAAGLALLDGRVLAVPPRRRAADGPDPSGEGSGRQRGLSPERSDPSAT
jgi:drug/metabolite transporter (DMT)-like permease